MMLVGRLRGKRRRRAHIAEILATKDWARYGSAWSPETILDWNAHQQELEPNIVCRRSEYMQNKIARTAVAGLSFIGFVGAIEAAEVMEARPAYACPPGQHEDNVILPSGGCYLLV